MTREEEDAIFNDGSCDDLIGWLERRDQNGCINLRFDCLQMILCSTFDYEYLPFRYNKTDFIPAIISSLKKFNSDNPNCRLCQIKHVYGMYLMPFNY